MPVIRNEQCRRTETPNAVVTTLASPAQGGAGQAVWRVEMGPGEAGPLHTLNAELVWTILAGGAEVELEGETHRLAAGDTIVVPAGQPRRMTAGAASGVSLIGVAPAGVQACRVSQDEAGRLVAEAETIVPAWVG